MMTSAQVFETSVATTDSSPSQNYTHPDDQTTLLHVTPGSNHLLNTNLFCKIHVPVIYVFNIPFFTFLTSMHQCGLHVHLEGKKYLCKPFESLFIWVLFLCSFIFHCHFSLLIDNVMSVMSQLDQMVFCTELCKNVPQCPIID